MFNESSLELLARDGGDFVLLLTLLKQSDEKRVRLVHLFLILENLVVFNLLRINVELSKALLPPVLQLGECQLVSVLLGNRVENRSGQIIHYNYFPSLL